MNNKWGEVIFHADADSYYASVEIMENPKLRGLPVAVGGDVEQRHGIILAKSQEAKRFGIKTGEALWQAKAKCPDLIILPPQFRLYQLISKKMRKIMLDYTDMVEAYGLDLSIV